MCNCLAKKSIEINSIEEIGVRRQEGQNKCIIRCVCVERQIRDQSQR